ncbi:hypothetical protein [Thalassospira tepidiphila]|uniref:hypothetical protein n=1 Tax=Thalassospira tepidiphila TaxID=393657 RepID=UPI0030C6C90B
MRRLFRSEKRSIQGGANVKKASEKQKSASEKIAALILYVIPNQGGIGASDET